MFTATQSAIKEIKRRANKEGVSPYLRVAIIAGGCTGFSYTFNWLTDVLDKDYVFPFEDVMVYIDRKSMILLTGSTLDFKSGLMEKGFVIHNPLSKGSCGCGKSVDF